ncbi:MAG: DUF2892 domain-containing protein [Candidatus Moranbacteria bacterium]|nr:DUF2892 domain-containing protein [Candidatus Moranbacteria bacterium]NTW45513.1 DUF2892 domain-containing protein [Candidatus Moranbacteria bacterium]
MKRNIYRLDTSAWTVERIMFAIAGIMVAVFAALSILADIRFAWGDLFVGVMLVFFAMTGYCPMAILVDTTFDKKR